MKKALIVAYYWPPSGGSGVQRWLNLTKHFAENNWHAIVYTPENPDFDIHDESLVKEVSENVEVIKRPIWEPYGIYKKLFRKKNDKASAGIVEEDKTSKKGFLANWIRGNIFVPDPKIFWRKPSVKYLRKYILENQIDVLITTGTPHSMHLIGLDLKKYFPKIPWFADFRDPWSELDMLQSYHILPSVFKKYRKLEREVLKNSDCSITTSKVWAKDFERLGAKETLVLTNGYEVEHFQNKIQPYTEFVISHFGLMNHLRNPKKLWEVLESLCQENVEFSKSLRLHIGGTISKEILMEINEYEHLSKALKVFPYLNHSEVIEEYRKSAVLLLLLFNSESGRGNIPGKLFEYLASQKPILGFGPDLGDSSEIIRKSGNGKFFLYEDCDEIELKDSILRYFENRSKIEMNNFSEGYSRKNLTKRLIKHLENYIDMKSMNLR